MHLVKWHRNSSAFEYGSLDELQGYTLSSGYVRFASDGGNIIGEYLFGASPSLQRRYVYGADTDEPLVWYEGTGTSDKRWLMADERGSVVAVTNASGAATSINTYDEFGIPGASNQGRFQYTGQAWLSEVGLYYYKARIYSPTLGRFMQTDPIGYGDGMNWYNYVGGDPINRLDPSGLEKGSNPPSCEEAPDDPNCVTVTITAKKKREASDQGGGGAGVGGVGGVGGDSGGGGAGPDIVVHGSRPGPTPPAPGATEPPKTSIACGVFDDGSVGCRRVTYKELCSGASKRRKALTGLIAADTAIVGGSGVIKQLGKGVVARLVAAELAADVVDELMYCE